MVNGKSVSSSLLGLQSGRFLGDINDIGTIIFCIHEELFRMMSLIMSMGCSLLGGVVWG